MSRIEKALRAHEKKKATFYFLNVFKELEHHTCLSHFMIGEKHELQTKISVSRVMYKLAQFSKRALKYSTLKYLSNNVHTHQIVYERGQHKMVQLTAFLS